MGSPILGDLCELVLRKLEERVLVGLQHNILSYTRYVDDILIIWKTKPEIREVLKVFNSNAYGLTLELDQESHTEVRYLDVKISIANNNLNTSIYREPTYIPLFIPANSADPWQFKVAAFRALVARAFTHCSDTSDTYNELKHIKNIAAAHGYQQSLINKLAANQLATITTTDTRLNDAERKQVVITYEPSLQQIYNRIAKDLNLRVSYRRKQNIFRILSNAKDKSEDRKAPGVYRIPLQDSRFNRRITYIGSTYRSLEARLSPSASIPSPKAYDATAHTKTNITAIEISVSRRHGDVNPDKA
ncbi:uncharacterized protein LOC111638287 [Centruroides sculpturatus]|uniref:uncharacterized protein LOC111638287 n=1 Tax=Centruroides sculpturatus TaxID=218467 RepID=UPI000C6E60FF|nr:uncharacterized protein LOC111638287 [Centruroides sculpturatus]